jgi:hypothetical protein
MTRRPSTLLALALTALAIGACGDDDDGDSTEPTSTGAELSKEEFIAQADEICAKGDAAIDKQGAAFAASAGQRNDELVGDVIAPGLREEIEQIRALNPPASDKKEVDAFLDKFEEGVDALEENPDQLAGGPALQTVIEARALAADYGFNACAR